MAEVHAKRYNAYPHNLLIFDKTAHPDSMEFIGPIGELEESDELLFGEGYTSGGSTFFQLVVECPTERIPVLSLVTVQMGENDEFLSVICRASRRWSGHRRGASLRCS